MTRPQQRTTEVNAPSGRCSAYAQQEGADVCVYQYDSIAGHYVRAWDLSPGQLQYVIGRTLNRAEVQA